MSGPMLLGLSLVRGGALLRAAVTTAALLRMAALVFKYPPLDRHRAALLLGKEAACARLLRSLGSSGVMRAP